MEGILELITATGIHLGALFFDNYRLKLGWGCLCYCLEGPWPGSSDWTVSIGLEQS